MKIQFPGARVESSRSHAAPIAQPRPRALRRLIPPGGPRVRCSAATARGHGARGVRGRQRRGNVSSDEQLGGCGNGYGACNGHGGRCRTDYSGAGSG
jgi:hypothetical protein